MKENEKYPVNTRVEYAYEPRLTFNGNLIHGVKQYRIGFVKQIKKTWYGAKRYLICCTNREDRSIDEVKPSMIFGLIDKKDTKRTKEE